IRCASTEIDILIVAIKTAGKRAAVKSPAALLSPLGVALEQHNAGRISGTVKHRLRAFDNANGVVGFGKNISRWRIHSAAATAENIAAIHRKREARAGHTAKHGVTAG